MTSKNTESIENKPMVISIISMIGMITAIATMAFMLGQYQATINSRLSDTDERLERLEMIVEANTNRLNDQRVLNERIAADLGYMRQILENRLP